MTWLGGLDPALSVTSRTAMVLVALAVVLGAFGGRSQARARVAAESERLANSYVQGLDARAMKMP